MPDRPLIVLPSPAAASRGRLPSGGSSHHLPGRSRQGQRIGPMFETLRAYFEQRTVEFRASAAGQIPEEVIVFETVGSVANFLNAARRVPGLDFLAEWDVEDIAPDDDFYNEKRRDSHLAGRVFLVMTNQQALQQLLSLWQGFQSGRSAARGFAPFFDLFQHLRDVSFGRQRMGQAARLAGGQIQCSHLRERGKPPWRAGVGCPSHCLRGTVAAGSGSGSFEGSPTRLEAAKDSRPSRFH
jgi:hypothetical protein